MNNKTQRIDSFLKRLSSIFRNNPELKISSDMIYANLIELGIEERGKIDIYFNDWIKEFENVQNINVCVTETHNYFCQFNNMTTEQAKGDFIKIYVPVDSKHIYQAASMIFKYMAEKNIIHSSKIGSDVRFDDIVIRVKDEASANLVKQYIKNNSYIQEGLLPPNPFAITDDELAIVSDDRISYNNQVSDYISNYLNDLKSKNQLASANYQDFTNYVINKYNNTFIYGNEIRDFIKNKNLIGNKEYITTKLVNHMEVAQLLITSLKEDSSIKNYMDHWIKVTNTEYKQKRASHIATKLDEHYLKSKEEDTTELLPISKLEEILSNAIASTYRKYGLAQAIHALKEFINSNKATYFTNDNNAREMLSKNLTGNDAKKLINNLLDGKLDLDKYISYALKQNVLFQKQRFLESASIETLKKYGIEQLCHALNETTKNNFKAFTNTNNARELLINNVGGDNIIEIMRSILAKEGYDIENMKESLYRVYANRIQNIMMDNENKKVV